MGERRLIRWGEMEACCRVGLRGEWSTKQREIGGCWEVDARGVASGRTKNSENS